MKKHTLFTLIVASFLLNACNDDKQQTKQEPPKAEEIAVGTSIASLVKKQGEINKAETEKEATDKANAYQAEGEKVVKEQAENKSEDTEYRKISWEDLEIPGKGMDAVLNKFEKEIDAIPEGSLKEKEVMGRLQAALNSAPVNPELDKKKIKLSGFVSPLEIDEKEGVVKEFLLVPYFGACIHVPPPPLNQTLLIKPAKDQQIKLEDAYEPIWVSGVIHAESTVTKLAEAGYKISDVKIEPYTEHLQE